MVDFTLHPSVGQVHTSCLPIQLPSHTTSSALQNWIRLPPVLSLPLHESASPGFAATIVAVKACAARVRTHATVQVRRVYFVLHHVLKELSSKRLAADQRSFAEVSRVLRNVQAFIPSLIGCQQPYHVSRPHIMSHGVSPQMFPVLVYFTCSRPDRLLVHQPSSIDMAVQANVLRVAACPLPTCPLPPPPCCPLCLSPPQITSQLLDHVWSQWCSDLSTILSGLPTALAAPTSPQTQPLLLHFERWLLLLKILRRLVVFGFPSDAKTLEPVAAVSTCAPALLQVCCAC